MQILGHDLEKCGFAHCFPFTSLPCRNVNMVVNHLEPDRQESCPINGPQESRCLGDRDVACHTSPRTGERNELHSYLGHCHSGSSALVDTVRWQDSTGREFFSHEETCPTSNQSSDRLPLCCPHEDEWAPGSRVPSPSITSLLFPELPQSLILS